MALDLAIERDPEPYSRAVLNVLPSAAQAYKVLVYAYLAHHRRRDAFAAAYDYLQWYPADCRFATAIGCRLTQYVLGIALVRYTLDREPTDTAYIGLAWALTAMKDAAGATSALEASVALNPARWETYQMLATAYAQAGRTADAISTYEHTLELHPALPDARRKLEALRRRSSGS